MVFTAILLIKTQFALAHKGALWRSETFLCLRMLCACGIPDCVVRPKVSMTRVNLNVSILVQHFDGYLKPKTVIYLWKPRGGIIDGIHFEMMSKDERLNVNIA